MVTRGYFVIIKIFPKWKPGQGKGHGGAAALFVFPLAPPMPKFSWRKNYGQTVSAHAMISINSGPTHICKCPGISNDSIVDPTFYLNRLMN